MTRRRTINDMNYFRRIIGDHLTGYCYMDPLEPLPPPDRDDPRITAEPLFLRRTAADSVIEIITTLLVFIVIVATAWAWLIL